MIQAVIYGWVFGIERGDREAHVGAHIRIPYIVQLLLKYVVPVYLGVIFVMFCKQNIPDYYAAIREDDVALMSLLLIVGLTAMLLLLIHVAGVRWIRDGRFANLDNDGENR
jgi:hypothetical protein